MQERIKKGNPQGHIMEIKVEEWIKFQENTKDFLKNIAINYKIPLIIKNGIQST